jgi:type II secretory pathway component PulF
MAAGANRKLNWYVARARVQSKVHKTASTQDILGFFRMMTTLIVGGTPLLEGIKIAATQSESSELRTTLSSIARLMESGASFNAAAAKFPAVFDDYWVQLIRTGELTGQLHKVLERLVTFLETNSALQKKIMGALAYPAILACISVVALFVMMWKVVPTFTAFFKDFGGKVPAITQYVINLSRFFELYGGYVVVVVPIIIWGIRKYLKSETGNRNFTNLLLVLPMCGETMVELSMQKFCSNLALLLKSGTDLLDAMQILQSLFKAFPAYKDALSQVHHLLGQGVGLSVAMEQAHLFTALVTNMVKVGEASGQLIPVLEQLDTYYSLRAQNKIMALTSMMEPLIVIFMGAVIGTLLAAIYIPMFNMSGGGGK